MTPSESVTGEQLKITDEVLLLTEILTARANGSNDSQAGTSDEDLLYALEEAAPHLAALKDELSGRV